MKRKHAIVLAIYLLVLGHFVFSNYVRTIGPSYTIMTAKYRQDLDGPCDSARQLYPRGLPAHFSDCLSHSCPLYGAGNPPAYSLKGFPFAVNDAFASCNKWVDLPVSDFILARVLNYAYISFFTIASVLYLFIACRKPANTRQK